MSRILRTFVSTTFAPEGPIRVMLFGEAPGPRGADQSGIPFWGDRAGILVYRALVGAGLAEVPEGAFEGWDGADFKARGLFPRLKGVALGNAFPSCPTRDGHTFRAPTDAELKHPDNLARLRADLIQGTDRCSGRLRVITLGKRSAFILERIPDLPPFDLAALPHPSAQGLLQAAPGKGRGLRLADLQAAWEADLARLLQDA